MIDHPLLLDPERRRAFEDLLGLASGSERTWSKRWGWSRAKVRRFVAALVRAGLADIEKTGYGTAVRIRPASGPQPAHPPVFDRTGSGPDPAQDRPAPGPQPARLESRSLSRSRSLELGPDEAVNLIRAMNHFFWLRFDDEFDEVSEDNLSSLATARKLLREFAAADVIDELRKAIALFNPSKHGKGKLPWSLAFFEKGLFKALHARAKRDAAEQNEMVLLGTIAGGAETKALDRGTKPAAPEPIGATLRRMGVR